MYDSQEISKVSPNLSLRLSPSRKYRPEISFCPHCCCCPCKCCHSCHCCPCTCFLHSPSRLRSNSPLDSLKNKYSQKNTSFMGSTNFETKKNYKYNSYEQQQFNDFLKKLMTVESEIEKIKIELSLNPDFNCEDVFRIFELDGRGFLDQDDLKYGLNLLNIYPTKNEIRLLIKRFDLQKQGCINFADFFDIIVPFEKDYRTTVEQRLPRSCCPCRCIDVFSLGTINTLKKLFNFIIKAESEINNLRRTLGSLRIKLRDVFGVLDFANRGFFNNSDLVLYAQKENINTGDEKDMDLLFIRLDKNRNGKIDYREVEDELQTLY